MADADYEYEKMRCELLGLPAPEEPAPAARAAPDDCGEEGGAAGVEAGLASVEEMELNNDQLRNVTGGLDELNSILSVTHKKLNKFKVVCGSLTNLLKLKVGGTKTDEATSSNASREINLESEDRPDIEHSQNKEEYGTGDAEKAAKRTSRTAHGYQEMDVCATMGTQIDKLDTLILKAEQAELSMSRQNKQMREYISK